jgi:drug/metabolite transporter (DMT)-like permease
MEIKWGNVLLFILLSFIWGSSFILMKAGLMGLDAFQVASVRIIASGLVLLPMLYKSFKIIPINKIPIVFLSGALGSLFPAYLFCIAETGIDSSLAGMLNALTPIFVIITGALFFKNITSWQKIIGVLIAFTGCVFLFLSESKLSLGLNLWYLVLIILATIMYGFNVNLVQKHLKGIPSLQIVSMALALNAIPALIVLVYSGFFQVDFHQNEVIYSIGFSCLLGAVGTSLANILFYILIKNAGAIFSSMVTYGIPFVAITWGYFFGESVGLMKIVSLFIILLGVYWANRNPSVQKH